MFSDPRGRKVQSFFAGHCTSKGADKTTVITGRKFYLWGDVQDQTNDETGHSPKARQTVTEHKLTAIEDARDKAVTNSLAVATDFMSTKYDPPREQHISNGGG